MGEVCIAMRREERERVVGVNSMDMLTTTNRPSVHPSIHLHEHVRSVKTVKRTILLLEIPPILEKNMTYETTDRTAICPATHPAAVPRIHREY